MIISNVSTRMRPAVMAVVAVVASVMFLLTGTAVAHADQSAPPVSSVSVRVEGNERTAADMLERLRTRGARKGIAVTSGGDTCQLRILVLARGPQWHQVFGVSASGAVAVLDSTGDLLFMHLRQKEPTVGNALDDMADEILRRLPALLRGEKMD